MTSSGAAVAAFVSIAVLLLVPALFALGVIGFASGRRLKALAMLAGPLALGVLLLFIGGCTGLAGAWLIIPAAQVGFLHAVAEIFARVSGRELNNIIESFINVRHAIDTLVCTFALVLAAFVPSLLFYQVFVVNEMCRL